MRLKSAETSSPVHWESSIAKGKALSYSSFFQHQHSLLQKLSFQKSPLDPDFSCRESRLRPARIGNLCFSGGKFRKVRMTYFDGGEAVQVFNTLWYPRYEYDLPLLGVDLISLGTQRVLSVMDFQPLFPSAEYSQNHIDFLRPIREKYPDLHGTMSGKIYDDISFFSSQMLYGRFTDESKLSSTVLPAFTEYLAAYLQHAEKVEANHDPQFLATVKARQAEYDAYSALKDPAVGLFDAYFGKEWSDRFVHEYLFSHSPRSNTEKATTSAFDTQVVSKRAHNVKVDATTGVVSIQGS
eukprot:gene6703-4834_t